MSILADSNISLTLRLAVSDAALNLSAARCACNIAARIAALPQASQADADATSDALDAAQAAEHDAALCLQFAERALVDAVQPLSNRTKEVLTRIAADRRATEARNRDFESRR